MQDQQQRQAGESYGFADSARQHYGLPQTEQDGLLGTTVQQGQQRSPELAARILRLQRATGIDEDLIERHVDELEQEVARADFQPREFRRRSPKLAQWLSESPNHIAIVRDALEDLGDLERLYWRRDDPARPLSQIELDAVIDREVDVYAQQLEARKPTSRVTNPLLATRDPNRRFETPEEASVPLELDRFDGFATIEEAKKAYRQRLLAERLAEEKYIAGVGPSGFWEEMGRRVDENPLFLLPFISSVPEISRIIDVYRASKAIESGRYTEADHDLVVRFGRLAQAAERRGTNVMGKVANIAASSVPFMLEFALTGGAYSATKVVVEKTVRGALSKVLSGTARGIASKTAGVLAGTATRTVVGGGLRIATDQLARMMPASGVTVDDAGKFKAVILAPGDDFLPALAKATGSQYIENLSELSGGALERIAAPLKAAVAARYLRLPRRSVPSFVTKVTRAAGWNGILGEMSEERVADWSKAALGIEPWQGWLPPADQLLAEAIAFGIPGAAISLSRRFGQPVPRQPVPPAPRTTADPSFFQRLAQIAKSPLFQRAPKEAEELITRFAAGSDITHAYADIDLWNAFEWKDQNGQPVTPRAMAAQVMEDGGQAFDAAMQTGEPLQIPVHRYAATIARSDANAYWQRELLTDPDQETVREKKQREERMQQAEAAVAETQRARQTSPVEGVAERQAEELEEQLRVLSRGAPGEMRMGEQYIQDLGAIEKAVLRTLGTKAGLSPDELQQLAKVTIERPSATPAPRPLPAGGEAPPPGTRPEPGAVQHPGPSKFPPDLLDRAYQQTAGIRRGEEDVSRFGLKPGRRYRVRQIARAFERRTRKLYGKIDKDDRSEKAEATLANWIADEVQFELEPGRRHTSALGWYTTMFQAALDILGRTHPEFVSDAPFADPHAPPGLKILGTRQNARNFMTLLFAITSDGQRPVANMRLAERAYLHFLKRATLPQRAKWSLRSKALQRNFRRINTLFRSRSAEALFAWLLEEGTVSELREAAQAEGIKFSPQFLADTRLPRSMMILGPKLGAFFANLMGTRGYLTMDLWWSRTFNRYRGTLLDKPGESLLTKFKKLLRRPDMSDQDAIRASVQYRESYEAKGFKKGTQREKTGNNVYKDAYINLLDAPFNASDRAFMMRTVERAREQLLRDGYVLTIADVQAIIWYYEKRLYGQFSARSADDISYKEAARRLIEGLPDDEGPVVETPDGTHVPAPEQEETETTEETSQIDAEVEALATAVKPAQIAVNLSAATRKIEGLKRLWEDADKGDQQALQLLQDIAYEAIAFLTSGIPSLKIERTRGTGLYAKQLEPTLDLKVSFAEQDRPQALAALARFAQNFEQEAVYVRGDASKPDVGDTYDDGSYNTPVYRLWLKAPLDRARLENVVEKSGLDGLTATDQYLEFYYVGNPKDAAAVERFERAAEKAKQSLKRDVREAKQAVARLWPYGDGAGRIPYGTIRGDVRPGPTQDNRTAHRIAQRLAAREVIPPKPAPTLTPEQEALQREIATAYDAMRRNALHEPLVRAAYDALAREVRFQFQALPIRVEIRRGGEPYKNSAEMRRDVLENNHLFIYGTDASTFGPKGVTYDDHPLLRDSGLSDINGKRLLVNDLLRAVHDYYAHTMTQAQFGPLGEEAAWRVHMAMTANPLARWALTSETRGQNSWVNFGPQAAGTPLKDRPFAEQKVDLLPLKYALIGDPVLDGEMRAVARHYGRYAQTLAPQWYSRLERVIEDKMPVRAPAEQLRGIIKEIKEEERHWSGIDEYLKDREQVEKRDLLEFLKGRRLEIREVMYGGVSQDVERARQRLEQAKAAAEVAQTGPKPGDKVATMRTFSGKGGWPYSEGVIYEAVPRQRDGALVWKLVGRFGGTRAGRSARFRRELEAQAPHPWVEPHTVSHNQEVAPLSLEIATAAHELRQVELAAKPKYTRWTLPGAAEEHRELLFTLPLRTTTRTMLRPATQWIEVRQDVHGTGRWFGVDSSGEWDVRSFATREEAVAALRVGETVPLEVRDVSHNFTTSHFVEPNVLAHVRFNVRVDADGHRVLFLEEIQSDWHQEGRRVGYRTTHDHRPIAEIIKSILKTGLKVMYTGSGTYSLERADGVRFALVQSSDVSQTGEPLTQEQYELADELHRAMRQESQRLVPDAPLKKTWHEFVLKRMIRYAAENGFDRIAWTTGVQQAERYDLSKQVEAIRLTGDFEQSIEVSVMEKGKDYYAHLTSTTKEQLEEVIGKDLAKKALEDGQTDFAGVDLKIGGEGMRGFYDVMIPGFLRKFGQRYGATVGETKIRRTLEKVHAFDITPQLRDAALYEGFALFQPMSSGEEHLGAFLPPELTGQEALIELAPKANFSTMIHELGHRYLDIFARIAARPDVPAEFRAEFQRALDWLGVKDLEAWTQLGLEGRRQYHEKWAEAFVEYVNSGKAPTAELQGAFRRFLAWLLSIYHKIRGDVSPEVRVIFDSLLATQEEIAATQAEQEMQPLFPEHHRELIEKARHAAEEKLNAKKMAEIRRRESAAWQAEAAQIRPEIEQDVNADRAYIAEALVKFGTTPDGKPIAGAEGGMKLATELLERYGEETLRALEGAHTRGGAYPDDVAELTGFSSGDELIRTLANLESREALIERRVNERMEELHPLMTDDEVREEAQKAVHSEHWGQVLRESLQYLASEEFATLKQLERRIMRRPPSSEDVRRQAEQIIHAKKVREVDPRLYRRAEAKAARQAIAHFQRGDFEAAFDAKYQELLNHELYRVAVDVREDVDKKAKWLTRFETEKVRAEFGKAGADYLEQIDAIMERFSFRKTSLRALDKRTNLREWLEKKRAEDPTFNPEIPEKLLDEAFRTHYRELTYADLVDVHNTVKHLAHLVGLKTTLLQDAKKRRLDDAAAAVRATIEQHSRGVRPREEEPRTPAGVVKRWFGQGLAFMRRWDSLMRQMDGFEDGGTLWETFSVPKNAAGLREAQMTEKAAEALDRLWKPYSYAERARMQYVAEEIPGTGRSFTRMAQLMIALNWGNEDSRQKVMDGRDLTHIQVQTILDRLDERDWKFVQGVWDFIESYWPDIAALHERVTGLAPAKVEAAEVHTRYGVLRGGYFPLKYEGELSRRAEKHDAQEVVERALRGATFRATTKHGHRKARVAGVQQPIRTDFGVIFEHVAEVIHDLTHYEWLMDVNKLLDHSDVYDAIRDHYGKPVHDELRKAVQDIAGGDLPSRNFLERVIGFLRRGTVTARLGFKVTTALLQPLGLTQSMVRIGPTWVMKGFLSLLGGTERLEGGIQEVLDRSEAMRLRGKTFLREIHEVRNSLSLRGPITRLDSAAFWLISKTQQIVDVITWRGAFEKAMHEAPPAANAEDLKEHEQRAVALADQAVRDSQGGGQIHDLAQLMRGGPMQKLFTTFMGYFNTRWNLAAESVGRVRSISDVPKLSLDLLLLYWLPASVSFVLFQALRGGDEDELAKKYLTTLAVEPLNDLPLVRELTASAQGRNYEGPAGLHALVAANELVQQLRQGDADRAFWRSLNEVGGNVAHYPSAQLDATARGFLAWLAGEAGPQAILVGPPLKR